MQRPGPREIVLHDEKAHHWLHFRQPEHIYQTADRDEVLPLLETVEARVEAEGRWAAGFLAYEAAPAFDHALRVRPPEAAFPLLWFGLYPPPTPVQLEPASTASLPTPSWEATVTPERYRAAIAAIKEAIAAGLTYQVNYTFRLRARFPGDPWRYFLELIAAQEPGYGAYVDTGRFAICSASPELFVRREGEQVDVAPDEGDGAAAAILGGGLPPGELAGRVREEPRRECDDRRHDPQRFRPGRATRLSCRP
jgi:para-aminobenzoate synthetase / 4-amino-4-deoxychorismate lyase